jgi:tetratricopeptide (TPR) repeat protein
VGRLYLLKKQLDQALEALQMSVALEPEYAEANYYLGEVYKEKNELSSAIQAYQQAVVLDSNYVQAFYKLGLTHKEDGKYEKAVEFYQKVIELEPMSKLARDSKYRLAVAYNALRQYENAVTAVQEYLQKRPTDAKALVALGEAYENLDQLEKAIEAYERAAKDSRWNQYATYKIDELKKTLEEE